MKKTIILISIALIATLSLTASAVSVTDSSGDVFHWVGTNYMDWSWDVGDKPNIDITEVTYDPGSRLTISMKVAGSIGTEKVWYHVYFNTSNAYYHLSYMPDDVLEPEAFAYPTNFDEMSLDDLMNYTEPSVETSVNGNTITATIDWVTDSHEMVEFWAWAQQWENDGEAWSDYYIDFAPNEYSYFGEYEDYYSGEDTGGDDTGSDDTGSDDTGSTDSGETDDGDQTTNAPAPSGTPGFEFIALVAAFAAILFIVKKRR